MTVEVREGNGPFGGWLATSEPDQWGFFHTVPLDDLRSHELGDDCPCGAERDPQAANHMIHRSYDGREDFEDGTRKVS